MEVFLNIRRKKTTLCLHTSETTTIGDVKRMVEGILKVPVTDQMILKGSADMDDNNTLASYGLNSQTARAHTPAVLGLCLRDPNTEKFETLEITPYSTPPDLPEVMKGQENVTSPQSQEQLVGQARP